MVHSPHVGQREPLEVTSFLLSVLLAGLQRPRAGTPALTPFQPHPHLLPLDTVPQPSLGEEGSGGGEGPPRNPGEHPQYRTPLHGAEGDPEGLWDLFFRNTSAAWVAQIKRALGIFELAQLRPWTEMVRFTVLSSFLLTLSLSVC